MRQCLVLFTVLIALISSGRAERLDEFVDSYAKSNKFNGTVLIYSQTNVQYRKSFGFANFAFKVTNNPATKFKIASITKLFTSVLVMQMHERGTLDLTKTINHYLPEYKGDGGSKVTLHQLLRNTSGIRNMDTVKSIEDALKNGVPVYQRPLTVSQLVDEHCSGPLVNEPGKVFDYNNADFVILGLIIEKLQKKPYGQVLKENILRPLEMENSGLLYQSDIIEGLADTYFYRTDLKRLVPDLPVYPENWFAAGAMYSTADDLLKFSQALFGLKLLKQAALNQMFVSGLGEYGYGTWVYDDYEIRNKRYTAVKRPGGIMGAQTVLFHVLGTDATIIILSNAGTTSIDDFVFEIAKRLDL